MYERLEARAGDSVEVQGLTIEALGILGAMSAICAKIPPAAYEALGEGTELSTYLNKRTWDHAELQLHYGDVGQTLNQLSVGRGR